MHKDIQGDIRIFLMLFRSLCFQGCRVGSVIICLLLLKKIGVEFPAFKPGISQLPIITQVLGDMRPLVSFVWNRVSCLSLCSCGGAPGMAARWRFPSDFCG